MPFVDRGNRYTGTLYAAATTAGTDTNAATAAGNGWSFDAGTVSGTNINWTTNVTFTYDTVVLNDAYRVPAAQPVAPAAMPVTPANRRLKPSKEEKLAEILLLENLNEEQRAEYKRLKYFRVIVGEKIYRIKRGRVGNIELIDDAGIVARYCVHPAVGCPDQDTMLAQKLMLENDEKELLRLANVHFQRAA